MKKSVEGFRNKVEELSYKVRQRPIDENEQKSIRGGE